jgi:biotin/methionine sulfoxide reductase
MTLYTQGHWGIYEVEANASGVPALNHWRGDPDPNDIDLHALSPRLQRVRVSRPSVRRSWLEGGPGTATALRGR